MNEINPSWKDPFIYALSQPNTEPATKQFIGKLLDYLGPNPTVTQYEHVAGAMEYLFELVEEEDRMASQFRTKSSISTSIKG